MFNRKGFSSNGILITVLILGAIGFVVWYVLGNFVESSRVKDAERIIGIAVDAQDRYMMSRGHYTQSWTALNAIPLVSYVNQKGNYINEEGTILLNKGGGVEHPNNGFKIYFDDINGQFFIVAERVNGRYHYSLVRPMSESVIYCVAPKNPLDEKLCMEYMNIKNASELPADPRPSYGGYGY